MDCDNPRYLPIVVTIHYDHMIPNLSKDPKIESENFMNSLIPPHVHG